MPSGWTNKGLYQLSLVNNFLGTFTLPGANYCVHLVTNAVAPVNTTNTLDELTEAAGGGYEEITLTIGSTDFDSSDEDTSNTPHIQCRDLAWTAESSTISGIYYAVLTDEHATPANREVYAYWDLSGEVTVADGQTLTLQNCELSFNNA